MKLQRIAIVLAMLTLTGVAAAVPAAAAPARSPAPYCGMTWGSQEKVVLLSTNAPVTNARTGRHDCWDRLVVDLGGTPATGYTVAYTDSYRFLEAGPVIPVAGGARLMIRAYAPAAVPWSPGDHVRTPGQFKSGGYRTFRDLVYGGSNGLNTELALGVRARLPFRVFVLTGPGESSRLVIDVLHRW